MEDRRFVWTRALEGDIFTVVKDDKQRLEISTASAIWSILFPQRIFALLRQSRLHLVSNSDGSPTWEEQLLNIAIISRLHNQEAK